jgi:DNA-binding PadR family transcriptional regulator
MNDDISDEEFLGFVLDVGARIAPHLRAEPLSQKEVQELDKRLEAHRPFLRELTEQDMKTIILKLLTRRPLDVVQIVSALEGARFALKDGGAGAIHALVYDLAHEDLLTPEGDTTEIGSKAYAITDKGRAQLPRRLAECSQLAAWCDRIIPTIE